MKPTANLNFMVIQFTMNSPQVHNLIAQRDANPQTFGMEIRCGLIGNHSTPNELNYRIDFVYQAPAPAGQHDDITAHVRVLPNNVFTIMHVQVS